MACAASGTKSLMLNVRIRVSEVISVRDGQSPEIYRTDGLEAPLPQHLCQEWPQILVQIETDLGQKMSLRGAPDRLGVVRHLGVDFLLVIVVIAQMRRRFSAN